MKLRYHYDLAKTSRNLHHTTGNWNVRMNFSVDLVGCYLAYPRYYTEREEMDCYLLLYTTGGSGLLRYQGQEYHLTAGSVAVIDCKEYQFYQTLGESWAFHFVHFSGESAEKYYEMFKEQGTVFMESISNPLHIQELFLELEKWAPESGMISDLRLSNAMDNLFTELLVDSRDPWKEEAFVLHRDAILGVQNYMKKNFRERITLEEMAAMASMSKYYFIKVFKKAAGISPGEYLKYCRINEAKRLLKETSYPVSQIAELVGYGNANIFIQNFKQCVGITPLKYRR